jgi:hypothetical protein
MSADLLAAAVFAAGTTIRLAPNPFSHRRRVSIVRDIGDPIAAIPDLECWRWNVNLAAPEPH